MRTTTEPGQCISVDQLESRTPGLIAQVKGWLTKKRYQAATIFVDHYSSLPYVFLQKSTNAEDTLAAKISFERYAERHGVKVQADNGRFVEMTFMQAIKDAGQTITFCIRRSILLTMSLYVNFFVRYDTYWVRNHSYIVSCNCDIALFKNIV